jgi:hypothetical protein
MFLLQLNICMQIKMELSQYLDCISTLCCAVCPPSQCKLRYKVLKAVGQKQQMSTESWYWLHFFFTCDYIHDYIHSFVNNQLLLIKHSWPTAMSSVIPFGVMTHSWQPPVYSKRCHYFIQDYLSCCQGLFLLCHLFFGILLIRYNSWYSK